MVRDAGLTAIIVGVPLLLAASVELPHSSLAAHCPVAALRGWLEKAELSEGYVFPADPPQRQDRHAAAHRGGRWDRAVLPGMSETAINDAVKRACCRALGPDNGKAYTAHSLRAGFATYAYEKGASDRAIACQTRHRSLASLNPYIRIEGAWNGNAATALGL